MHRRKAVHFFMVEGGLLRTHLAGALVTYKKP